jgi:hypothetical protein
MSPPQPKTAPRVVYSPPPTQQLEAFAREVCRDLGDEFFQREVVDGFSTFIKVMADVKAKHLNGYVSAEFRGEVDNAE